MDNRLLCIIGSEQLTRNSKYKVIQPREKEVQVMCDDGVYRWIKRDRFLSREELERCRK